MTLGKEMAKRKYLTEFALNSFGTWRILLQQDNLEDPDLPNQLPPDVRFHIYMVTRRPRIAFDPESLKFEGKTFTGAFTIQKGSTLERHEFTAKNLFHTDKLKIECPYPHTECKVFDEAGKQLSAGKVPLILTNFSTDMWEHMDLEVLYVGQSYGEEGSRVAPDHLKSHSTLQGIYAEAIRRPPDMDIWIVLWSFEPILMTSIGGGSAFEVTMEQDQQHRDRVLDATFSEQQQINFTEAALIRYFQPEYNKIYKDTFPNPGRIQGSNE